MNIRAGNPHDDFKFAGDAEPPAGTPIGRDAGRPTSPRSISWCSGIIAMSEERARQPDNFDVSSRGWCYLIESHGLKKGDFDKAQNLINDCRKSGRLPIGICCEDERGKPTI